MKKNRLRIIFLLFLISFLILLSRLFDLTVIKGEKYREFSDNNRIKQINIDSSRGIIYDRNGKELATNKSMYNLNAYKDRLNSLDVEQRNNILENIVLILEEDGVNYLSNSSLSIYEYIYKSEKDYFSEEISPSQKVIELIKENKLLKEIFNSEYKINNDTVFYPVKRMKDYLVIRGKDVPIEINTENGINLEFVDNDDYKKLISSKVINKSTEPIEYIIDNVENDDSLINYIISHPLSRKIVYDILDEKNLLENLDITNLVFKSDIDYLEKKASLNKINSLITMESNAQEDFLNLVKSSDAMKDVLSNTYKKDDRLVVPASILINLLEKENINTNIAFNLSEDQNRVEIEYISNDASSNEIEAIDYLIDLAEKKDVLDKFILSEDILNHAQDALFSKGIYPKIYISSWEYSYIKDKNDLLDKFEDDIDANEYFKASKEKYELDNVNEYINFSVLNIIDNINSRGYLAYSPINIAKNLNKDSVVRIEENIPKDSGFEIVFESNRFYPNRNTSSHILGYIGNISEDYEVEEFVEYKKYDFNDVVGKSGLEESFEDTLRGSKGKKLVYTDVYGRTTDVIEKTDSVPGNNLYTTIELEYQKEVEKILDDLLYAMNNGTSYNSYYGKYNLTPAKNAKIASAVVMDVNNGEILASVSKPDYDPNLFVNGISNYDWNNLNDSDPLDIYAPRPILNNVIQSAFTPGSTFKTVTSLAALENGLSATNPIDNYGFVQVGDNRFNDLIYTNSGGRWGNLDLYDALKVSSNYYFYVLGLGYNPNKPGDNDIKVTLEDIESMTSRLGLQSKTNIEINYPSESSGYYPNLHGKRNILKARLRRVLEKDLDKYIKEGIPLSENKLNNDINTILSWIDRGPEMTRKEVADNLDEMKYNPELRLENSRESLADKIKYTYLNMAKWTVSDSMNMVIGQGQNAYTPMQMVQLTGIIANEGKFVHPTLVREIKDYKNEDTIFKKKPKITETGIDPNHFKEVKKGMYRASETARLRYNLPFKAGSKTGTAQIGSINPRTGTNYDDIVSEILFAPYDEPEIAVYLSVVEGRSSVNIRGAVNDIIYAYYKYVKNDSRFTNDRIGEHISEENNANNKDIENQENIEEIENVEDTVLETGE